MAKKITPAALYTEAHLQRKAGWADTNIFDFRLEQYADKPMVPMFCKTTKFNSVGEEAAKVILLDQNGNDYKTVTISRTDFDVWPFHPSTIFSADGANQHGVLWVKEGFFENKKVDRATVEPADRPKWPAALGKKAKSEMLMKFALELKVGPALIEQLRKKLDLTPKWLEDLRKRIKVP